MNQKLYQTIVMDRTHRAWRRQMPEVAEGYAAEKLSPEERMTRRFEWLCAQEKPTFLPEEKICFLRGAANIPEIFTEEEWAEIKKHHHIHEMGYHSNLTANYGKVLKDGLLPLREKADAYGKRSVDAILDLVERYRQEAMNIGRTDIAEILAQVPAKGARNFLKFALWLEGNYHNTMGRFDQYMYPYLKADLDSGALTEEDALELLEEFFLSLSRDSDLYPGVQQGDNGQSMMLGGRTREGVSGFNTLSRLCLIACRELKLTNFCNFLCHVAYLICIESPHAVVQRMCCASSHA